MHRILDRTDGLSPVLGHLLHLVEESPHILRFGGLDTLQYLYGLL